MKFKLSEISKISNGKKAVFYDDGTVPVYGANGPIGTTQNSKYNVGDIVIGRVGANAGAVHRPISNFWASDNTMVVTPGERVRSEYLTWLLQKTNFNQMTSGSAQPLLNQDILNSIDFEIPGLSEQDYVISVIEPFENQMGVLTSINDNLLELAQQIFVGKYLSKQDSFPMTTLSEIVGVKTDTFNPKKSNDNEVAHFSLPAFDSGSVPTVDLVDSIKSNKNIITQYTVLASKMNPTTKRVWIPNYVQGMTNVASTEFLTFNASDEYQQAFIWAVVDSEGYQNHLISGATGSTGSRQRIKPGDAYSFEVGYNPDEAHRIGMILNPLLQQVKNNRDEIVTLVQLRNNLLTNLLN